MHGVIATLTFVGAASAAIGVMAVTIAPQRARIGALLAQAWIDARAVQ